MPPVAVVSQRKLKNPRLEMNEQSEILFIEFYNLHLRAGVYPPNSELVPSSDGLPPFQSNDGVHMVDEDPAPVHIIRPDKIERQELVKLLSKYNPNIVEETNFKEAAGRKFAHIATFEEPLAMLQKHYRPDRKAIVTNYIDMYDGSLGMYELRKSHDLRMRRDDPTAPIRYHGDQIGDTLDWIINGTASQELSKSKQKDKLSWFDSDDFLEFSKQYYHTRRIVEGYMSGAIYKWHLRWLNKEFASHNKEISQTLKYDTKTPGLPGFSNPAGEYVGNFWPYDIVANYEFDIDSYAPQPPRYGLCIQRFLGNLHMSLVELLVEKPTICCCKFEGTERLPSCNDIFVPAKSNQLYCSKKCYDRARRRRRYEKVGE